MGFFDFLRSVVDGSLWGDVSPSPPPPAPKTLDARQHAVKALLDYLAVTQYSIDNSPNPPKLVRLARDRYLDEWPDSAKNLLFPCVAVLPGEPEIIPRGFANEINEASLDAFGPGTALVTLHEHRERIVLEVWATTRFERASIVAGIEQAFDPAEEMSGLRLELPDHYGQTARFTLEGNARIDDEEDGKRRRRARITVRMEVDVVKLVQTVPLDVRVEVDVEAGPDVST